jgi:cobalt-zinc-cadmium efflux system membrane fusion protein
LLALLCGACQTQGYSDGTLENEHTKEASADHDDEIVELSEDAVRTANIQTVLVTRASLGGRIDATAVITPNEYRMAHVSPRIPGRAIQVQAELGDRVETNEALAELDSIELGEKKSQFLEARASLEVARRNHSREKRLYKQHISSEKEFLEAKGDFERTQAAYRAAREALRLVGLSEEDIEKATWGGKDRPLSHFPLLAPFSGTVIERHITIGELIEPDQKPFTIADLSSVWVVIDVYEKDLTHVREGTRVALTVDAFPERRFPGTITYVSHLLAPATRTAQARVVIDNGDGLLRPGMFARATIETPAQGGEEALVLPRDAVQRVGDEPVAFVERKPGTYEVRELALGREVGDSVEVRSGVAAGERVVTIGSFYLKSTLSKGAMAGHGH